MIHPIVTLRPTPPRFTPSGRGVCFSIALFALGCVSGAAQCSQTPRPFAAADSADVAAAVAPGASAQPAPPAFSSSTPDAPAAVRFAPGPTFQNVCAAECTAQKVPANHVVADSVGAGLGAGVGAAIAAGSPPSIALIPAESQLEFTLASPIAVFPPDQATAAHLAQGMHRGGPVLYVRGENQ